MLPAATALYLGAVAWITLGPQPVALVRAGGVWQGLSSGIEFTQLYIPGRVSDVRDLASNSLGALIGVLVALVLTWPSAVRRRRALELARGARPRTGSIRVA